MKFVKIRLIFISILYCGMISVIFSSSIENDARKELFSNYDYQYEGGCSLGARFVDSREWIDITPFDLCYLTKQKAKKVEFLRFFKRLLLLSRDSENDALLLENDINNSGCIDMFFPEVKNEVEQFFKKIGKNDVAKIKANKLFLIMCKKLNTDTMELSYLK